MATKQDDKTTQGDGKMTVKEAGHLGGEATSATHDHKFYENIGSEGGQKSPGKFEKGSERAREAGSHSHDNDGKKDE